MLSKLEDMAQSAFIVPIRMVPASHIFVLEYNVNCQSEVTVASNHESKLTLNFRLSDVRTNSYAYCLLSHRSPLAPKDWRLQHLLL